MLVSGAALGAAALGCGLTTHLSLGLVLPLGYITIFLMPVQIKSVTGVIKRRLEIREDSRIFSQQHPGRFGAYTTVSFPADDAIVSLHQNKTQVIAPSTWALLVFAEKLGATRGEVRFTNAFGTMELGEDVDMWSLLSCNANVTGNYTKCKAVIEKGLTAVVATSGKVSLFASKPSLLTRPSTEARIRRALLAQERQA